MADSIVQSNAVACAVLGVADLANALQLWRATFGFTVIAQHQGADAETARLWNLAPERIAAQALVSTPGAATGRVLLVQFNDPLPPVRAGASATDLVPKAVNLALRDLPQRYEELSAAGQSFRAPYVNYPSQLPNGGTLQIFEVQCLAPDDINLGMLELVGVPFPFTPQGFAGMTNFVAIVPDLEREAQFWQDVIGFGLVGQHRLQGTAIEKLIGLPPGGALAMRILGSAENALGRVQLIQYEGATGANLYPKAQPPALGTLHVQLVAHDLDALRERAARANVQVQEHGVLTTLAFSGRVLSLHSPAGLRLDVGATERFVA